MKVKIIISTKDSDGNPWKFCDSVHDGAFFTDVSYGGHNYGGGSPCTSKEEIERSIKHAQETITREGDTPVVVDEREKQSLLSFLEVKND